MWHNTHPQRGNGRGVPDPNGTYGAVLFPVESSTQGITYEQLQVLDLPETTLDSFIPPSMAFLVAGTAPGKATLVHWYVEYCTKTYLLFLSNAGVSRSATVVIAFLMLHRGMTFDDALATAKRARPSIRPNNGFRAQLQNLVPL